MGAGASTVSDEIVVANRTRLFKYLASEYEGMKAKGISDDQIATMLEKAIMNDSPEVLERMTDSFVSIPHPLRSRILIDYDAQTGHKIINREIMPPLSRDPSRKSVITSPHGAGSASPKSASEISKIEANCQATVELLRAQQTARLIVAVDGSDVAHQAFLTALRLRKSTDLLEVVHVYDPHATVPHHLKPEEVKLRYETELVSKVPSEHYKLTWVDQEDLTTRAVIVNYANQLAYQSMTSGPRLGLLICGVTGRRTAEDSPQVLGSVADLAFRAVYCPTVLVKKALPLEDKQRVFVLAADETERSWNAYLSTLFMLRPKDRLIVLHIYDEATEDAILDGVDERLTTARAHVENLRQRYERDIEDRGLVHAEVVNLTKAGGVPVHQILLDFSSERDADFIVVAPRLQETMSSVAEHLMAKGKANVIVVKN